MFFFSQKFSSKVLSATALSFLLIFSPVYGVPGDKDDEEFSHSSVSLQRQDREAESLFSLDEECDKKTQEFALALERIGTDRAEDEAFLRRFIQGVSDTHLREFYNSERARLYENYYEVLQSFHQQGSVSAAKQIPSFLYTFAKALEEWYGLEPLDASLVRYQRPLQRSHGERLQDPNEIRRTEIEEKLKKALQLYEASAEAGFEPAEAALPSLHYKLWKVMRESARFDHSNEALGKMSSLRSALQHLKKSAQAAYLLAHKDLLHVKKTLLEELMEDYELAWDTSFLSINTIYLVTKELLAFCQEISPELEIDPVDLLSFKMQLVKRLESLSPYSLEERIRIEEEAIKIKKELITLCEGISLQFLVGRERVFELLFRLKSTIGFLKRKRYEETQNSPYGVIIQNPPEPLLVLWCWCRGEKYTRELIESDVTKEKQAMKKLEKLVRLHEKNLEMYIEERKRAGEDHFDEAGRTTDEIISLRIRLIPLYEFLLSSSDKIERDYLSKIKSHSDKLYKSIEWDHKEWLEDYVNRAKQVVERLEKLVLLHEENPEVYKQEAGISSWKSCGTITIKIEALRIRLISLYEFLSRNSNKEEEEERNYLSKIKSHSDKLNKSIGENEARS